MIRAAISNPATHCYNCSEHGLAAGVDYCASCQYAYASEVAFRTDYADNTIGWFDTQEEANAAIAALVSTSDRCGSCGREYNEFDGNACRWTDCPSNQVECVCGWTGHRDDVHCC